MTSASIPAHSPPSWQSPIINQRSPSGARTRFHSRPKPTAKSRRVTVGRRTPPPSHPVRRRGQDHPDAPRRDRIEVVAVPAEQAQPPIAALVAGHVGTCTSCTGAGPQRGEEKGAVAAAGVARPPPARIPGGHPTEKARPD